MLREPETLMRRRIGDLDVNYEVEGSGADVILLHGAGADLIAWEEIASPLAAKFRVWRMDQRGCGRTRSTSSALPLSLARWTQDLGAFMDEMSIESAALVGWSLGGAVAINFAAVEPSRVTHLIPVGSAGPHQTVQDMSGFEIRRRMATSGASAEEIVDATFDFTKTAFSQWSRDENPHAVRKIREMLLRNDPQGYADVIAALSTLSGYAPLMGRITAPTLVICGSEDSRTPPELSKAINRGIPGSRLELMQDCGHYYTYEKPRELLQLITAFISNPAL